MALLTESVIKELSALLKKVHTQHKGKQTPIVTDANLWILLGHALAVPAEQLTFPATATIETIMHYRALYNSIHTFFNLILKDHASGTSLEQIKNKYTTGELYFNELIELMKTHQKHMTVLYSELIKKMEGSAKSTDLFQLKSDEDLSVNAVPPPSYKPITQEAFSKLYSDLEKKELDDKNVTRVEDLPEANAERKQQLLFLKALERLLSPANQSHRDAYLGALYLIHYSIHKSYVIPAGATGYFVAALQRIGFYNPTNSTIYKETTPVLNTYLGSPATSANKLYCLDLFIHLMSRIIIYTPEKSKELQKPQLRAQHPFTDIPGFNAIALFQSAIALREQCRIAILDEMIKKPAAQPAAAATACM